MPDTTMSSAFISYSRRDRAFVQQLYAALQNANRAVWIDWQDIPLTADWWAEICAGIDAANDFIFVISPDSVRSDVCYKEIEYAAEHHKRIVPIAHRPVNEQDDRARMHHAINAHQWIQFRPDMDFDTAFAALLSALDTDLAYIHEHTRLLVRALNWESRMRDPSQLLRGRDLEQAEAWLRTGEAKTNAPPTDLHREYITTSRRVERRRQRTARVVLLFSALILVLAMLASYLAWFSNEQRKAADASAAEARDAQNRAEAIGWAAQAQLELEGYAPERGVLLALASLERNPTWQGERALALAVLNSPARAVLSAHSAPVNAAAWSPDGTQIVTASSDHTVLVWDAAARQPRLTLAGFADDVLSVAWSPDGTRLLAGGEEGLALLWDAASGDVLSELAPGWAISAVAWSPDGSRCLTAHGPDLAAVIWDAAGTPLFQLEGHSDQVVSAAWSPDGSLILTASRDGAVILWDAATGESLTTLDTTATAPDARLNAAAWSPDGTRFATGHSDAAARLWVLSAVLAYGATPAVPPAPAFTLSGHISEILGLAWSPDSARIATTSADRSARLWNATNGTQTRAINGHTDEVTGAAWSPDGARLVTTSRDKTARLWDVSAFPLEASMGDHAGWVLEAAWSPDGSRIVTAGRDQTARIWDAATGGLLFTLRGHTNQVRSVAWSPDGSRVATGSTDRSVRIWDAQNGLHLATIRAHNSTIVSLDWSPDTTQIVTASADGIAKIWAVPAMTDTYPAAMEPVCTLDGHRGQQLTDVAWSPDGSRIATASRDNTAIIWDAATGYSLLTLQGHTNWVNSAAWSPDSTRIVTASVDDTAKVWDTATGALLFTLAGHPERVLSAAWSPGGTRIVTTSEDRTAKVWDATLGVELLTLGGHAGRVYTAAWSPDGTRIVTASADSTSKVWMAWEQRPDLVEFAYTCCTVRDLTTAERAQFALP